MKSEADFYPYQRKMIKHMIDHPFCGIYADMGLGKTSTTLTALLKLIRAFEVGKILIVAPLRVARKTWMDEIEEWSHLTAQFTVAKILGTPQQRMAGIAVDADIYMINRENFTWLCEQYRPKSSRKLLKPWPWEMVVIDESSSFKSQGSERWKSWRRVRTEIDRMIHLTGSPAPKGLKDLWAPMFMLDGGERLGKSEGAFEARWFDRIMQHPKDQYGKLQPKPGAEKEIYSLISDICISLVAEDYLDLPNVVLNWIPVTLSKTEMKTYKQFAKTAVLEMKTKTVTAVNAGILAGKLLQAANGAIYTDHPAWEMFHDRKLETLKELLIDNVNKNFMIMYTYKSDFDRISAMLSTLKGTTWRKLDTEQDEDDWNAGKIDYLLLHPASCGHGIQLQHGGELIVWFGLNWSLELYTQANARLIGGHRRMGKAPVIHHIIAEGTYDERVRSVLEDNQATQDGLMNSIKMEREDA